MRVHLGEREPGGGGTEENTTPSRTRRWTLPLALLPINGSAALLVMGRLLGIMVVLGFLYVLFVSDLFTNMARRMGQHQFDPESVRMHVQSSVDAQKMRETLQHYTSYAHLAGSEGDFYLAANTKKLFHQYGLEDVTVDEYNVYLNWPEAVGRAVEILGADDKPVWSARLEEEDDGGESVGHQTYVFHGHSKSGNVKGPLVYANYGSREDFEVLHNSGIETRGAIALVRYYGSQSDLGLKVKAAELAGFAGCIIYSDPADDGFLKGQTAPNGRWMPADGVQRGSVSLTNWIIGDPLTPGWESKKGLPKLSPERSTGLVKIPSIPISWRDAQVLLQHIKGFGQQVPHEWVGGVPDIGEWWMGNLSSPIVRLRNELKEEDNKRIWNVYGRITGIEQGSKSIIVGNHRDSWTLGATDPHSGTAVMLEMVRIFGDLVARGWRPLRTIEFMSWDAEEYNLMGSTEFVEKNAEGLQDDAYAYINLDGVVSGNTFHASGSPVFRRLVLQVLNRVYDPYLNATLRDLFDRRNGDIESLGIESDYVAFQNIAGTSSLDLEFSGDGSPTHSSYDNFAWMETVGDPGFVYHALLGQVLGLVLLELADRPIMPFDMNAYADSLSRWVDELRDWSAGKGANQAGNTPFDLGVLRQAADEADVAIREFANWELDWDSSILASNGWEPSGLGRRRCEYNDRMAKFDTNLLDLEMGGGIPNRTQFKHIIFGPQLWSSSNEAHFPAIRDAVIAGDWALANKMVEKAAKIINIAAANLLG